MPGFTSSLMVLLLAGTACAQCQPQWLPGDGIPGAYFRVSGSSSPSVNTTCIWDPDGGGPAGSVLVVAGNFLAIGTTYANYVAFWDGQDWHALGEGTNDWVYTLAALPNGDLLAGGSFSTAGTTAAARVARWNGTSWTAMGAGFAGFVSSLAVRPNGEIFAAGNLGSLEYSVARWDGTQWLPLPTPTLAHIWGLSVAKNGDLLAAGGMAFDPLPFVGRWNGSSWKADWGFGMTYAGARCAIETASGDIVVGGNFPGKVGKWLGNQLVPLGPGVELSPMFDLLELADGRIVALGDNGVPPRQHVALFNGSAWENMGSGISRGGYALTLLDSGHVVVGGGFDWAGGVPANQIALWRDGEWSNLGPGFTRGVHSLVKLADDRVLAVGSFTQAGGTPANRVAVWDAGEWSALGDGIACTSTFLPTVTAATELPNGDLVVVGDFSIGQGAVADYVARWNGNSWSPLGAGVGYLPFAVAALPNGDVVVGGDFPGAGGIAAKAIARWDGATWSAFPQTSGVTKVNALAVDTNGDLLVGGTFTSIGGITANNIARWNGSVWLPLGTGTNGPVHRILLDSQGDIIAGGGFTTAGGTTARAVARWDGLQWTPMGDPLNLRTNTIIRSPGGELLAAVSTGSIQVGIARWDGSAWSTFADGIDNTVRAMVQLPSGEILIGGDFIKVGGQTSAHFARYGCPPALGCYANCDGSTAAPVLNVADFGCFLNKFASGDAYANCDGSTVEPVLNVSDFGCFLSKFAAGCR